MKSERVTRAQRRYISSVQDLQNAIPNKLQRLGTITFPDFTVIAGTANKAKALQETLDKVMEVTPELEKIQKSRETKKKVGDVVIGCFRASYPFANLFLTVAKDASGVIKSQEKESNFLDTYSESLWCPLRRTTCFGEGITTKQSFIY